MGGAYEERLQRGHSRKSNVRGGGTKTFAFGFDIGSICYVANLYRNA